MQTFELLDRFELLYVFVVCLQEFWCTIVGNNDFGA